MRISLQKSKHILMIFRPLKQKKAFTDHDCYNFDETGLRVGVRRDQWVITKDESGRLYMEDPENREYLSSLEYVKVWTIMLLLQ